VALMVRGQVIEKRMIEIPNDVAITLKPKNLVSIKGKLGTNEYSFPYTTAFFEVVKEKRDKEETQFLAIWDYFPKQRQKSQIGTIEGRVKNMILGVKHGFTYKMKIIYAHFPITLTPGKDGVIVTGQYGTKEKRFIPTLPGVKVSVKGDDVILEGINIDHVSQSAARIQESTKLRGQFAKDPRIFQDGIYVFESGVNK
jgi:large subunit ribosomal protein L6